MTPDFDAIIVGAGMSGMYQLYRLRELGMKVRVYEAGSDVGGTWYWNRYPGARFDSESYSYGFSFSKEVLDHWEWSEHFSAQPETLRYVNFVADKFDLRRDMVFGTRVSGARFDTENSLWYVALPDGTETSCRFFITAIGALSIPQKPNIPGMTDFTGPSWHTAEWPHTPVSFAGKRVAVIGTGATAVQLIQEVAKTAGSLSIFQRRPNWCAPLHNSPITDEQQAQIKGNYDDIFARCRESHGGFLHSSDSREALEVSAQERLEFYEQLYAAPGFGIWMGNFRDVLVNEEANRTLTEFVAGKIRERVNDPALAERLIPRDHGFGTRRVPMETGYYEVFNQSNVELVDLRETPINRITESGIACRDAQTDEQPIDEAEVHRSFDLIIYATGFDAVTGAFDKLNIRGEDGATLASKWRDGPETLLGLSVVGFPNMFTLVGPHNAATFCNIPRCIEQNVEWVTDLLRHMRDNNLHRVAATTPAAQEWGQHVHETSERMLFTRQHVHETSERMLFTKVESWFMGYNPNRADKTERRFLVYAAGAPTYREKCDEAAAAGYAGFSFS